MSLKLYEEEKIRAIADKIRQKTGGNDTYTTSQMPEGIDMVFMKGYEKGDYERYEQMIPDIQNAYSGGYTVGHNDGYNEGITKAKNDFWNDYQNNGQRRDYNGAFSGKGWNDDNFNPKYELTGITSAAYMFQYTGIKNILVELDFSKCTSMSYTFANSDIEYIHSVKFGTSSALSFTFLGAKKLYYLGVDDTIYLNIDLKDSPLTKGSISNVIYMLSSTSVNKQLKLNKSAVDAAFETQPSLNDGSQSAEWLAIKNSKSNWQIDLV